MSYPGAPSIAETILNQAKPTTEPTRDEPTTPVEGVAAAASSQASEKEGSKDALTATLSGLLQEGAVPNPMEAQTQALRARLAAEQQRALALEVVAVQQYINRFPEGSPERAEAQAQADAWAVQKMAQLQIDQERGSRQALEAALLPVIQDLIYSQVSTKQGIPKEVLKKYAKTPQQLAALVEGWNELKKAENLRKRAETRIDSAPTASQTGSGGRPSVEEIRKKYLGSGNISGYLKELRQAANR